MRRNIRRDPGSAIPSGGRALRVVVAHVERAQVDGGVGAVERFDPVTGSATFVSTAGILTDQDACQLIHEGIDVDACCVPARWIREQRVDELAQVARK